MAIWANGIAGTIGGGAFEHRVMVDARIAEHARCPVREVSQYISSVISPCAVEAK